MRCFLLDADRLPQVTLSTSAGTTTTTKSVIPITATFSSPVTGVTASDFNGGTPFPTEAGVSYAVTGGPTEYVLTVTIDKDPRDTVPLSFDFNTATGSISPPSHGTSSALALTYVPPTPTFASSHGPSGTTVASSVILFTAVFDNPVSGVQPSDFNVVSSDGTVTWAESVSTTDNLSWVLAVSVASGFANTDFSVSMPRDSGAITDKNAAATNNGFSLTCTSWVAVPLPRKLCVR